MRFLLIIIIFFFQQASAQETKFLIRFTDKNNSHYDLANPTAFLSEKSLHRREKQNIVLDSSDLPVTPAYSDSIATQPSLHILNRSKWLNQLLVSVTDTSVLQKVRSFPFVLSAAPVNNYHQKKIKEKITINKLEAFSSRSTAEKTNVSTGILSPYQYGSSYNQIHIHHGEFLHDKGYHGETMTIALLDDGFNQYLTNPAFEKLRNENRILGTYDFVNGKISVNEEQVHGSNCFSIIAANIPTVMIGSAPGASYWLFKTEDDLSETPVEEQNWAAAAEFADSVGVDIISTSLGYAYFDNPAYDLDYAERNGHTSLVSLAANRAVAKGIIVTASMGNSGNDIGEKIYVGCPADGDSVYAVGAVKPNGQIATFSSWGPNSSGQVKPDGVSIGSGTALVGTDGNLYFGDGTSYSNPNLAGLIACLWQAFPEFSCHDILRAVREASDQYQRPDGRYGFGLPDFEKAYQSLTEKKLGITGQLTNSEWLKAIPVPFNNKLDIFFNPSVTGTASLQLLDLSGRLIQSETITVSEGQPQYFEMQISTHLATGAYFIRYVDAGRSKTIKVLKAD